MQPWNVFQKLLPLFLLPDLAMSSRAEPAGGEAGGLQHHTRLRQLDVSCKAFGSDSSNVISSPSALLVQDAASSPWLKPSSLPHAGGTTGGLAGFALPSLKPSALCFSPLRVQPFPHMTIVFVQLTVPRKYCLRCV